MDGFVVLQKRRIILEEIIVLNPQEHGPNDHGYIYRTYHEEGLHYQRGFFEMRDEQYQPLFNRHAIDYDPSQEANEIITTEPKKQSPPE